MHQAERALRGMESCCLGLLRCLPFLRRKSRLEAEEPYGANSLPQNEDALQGGVTLSQRRISMDRPSISGGQQHTGGFIGNVTNDIREDEMEDNMHHVAAIVSNLRNMAIDMGTELETQNKQIGTIYEKASSEETRVATANKRAGKLMK
eukprot:TCALIF_08585-PD protein Name:"Similar to Snap25 Synaptosomal-associated protein 25 (Drosophila melanogaster)" AED:0.52 eAED:0.52 QI:0/1/0.5/1/0.33/0.5/4/0/148